MEILGIVWAASIINQSAVSSSEVEVVGSEPRQHQLALAEGAASWFTPLAQAYGWGVVEASSILHSNYVFNTSWLATDSADSESESVDIFADSDSQFSPLLPVIGTGLVGIGSIVAPSLIEGESPDETVTSTNWDSWDVVAAVRIVEPAQPVSDPDVSAVAIDRQCLTEPAVPYKADSMAMMTPNKLQVWVHNHFIGEMNNRLAAQRLVDRFRALLQEGKLEPAQLHPLFGTNFVGGSLHSEVLFVVDEAMRSHPEVPAAAVAVQWINNLRVALDEAPLDLVQVQMAMDGLRETSEVIYGNASWYGPGFHGRKTANGERFDENMLTAAHKTLPFNTRLKVTNRLNGKSVVVRINDRGPYIGNRTLDLSKAAAQCLGGIGTGVIPYEAVFLESIPKPDLGELTLAQAEGQE
ncbi:MAG: septal ring lytic transglycosylase RlpA family protein [Leptolyngbyaceae cyanobacterium]